MSLHPHERAVRARLREWQDQPPGWGTRLLSGPTAKMSSAMQVLVPPSAIQAALEGVNRVALRLSDERAILQRGNARDLAALRAGELEHCDKLATTERRRAMALGGVGGTAFGVAGAAGLVADVPVLITLALRAIHRVGLCYGDAAVRDPVQRLPIGIFALASANTMDEKRTALDALRTGTSLSTEAWRDGIERTAEREIAKNAAVYSLQNLARTIGVNLGQRKAAGTIPVLGALVGGSVNAWYVHDVATTAQYVFQDRWLRERRGSGVLGMGPVAALPPPADTEG